MLASVRDPQESRGRAYRFVIGAFLTSLLSHYANHQMAFQASCVGSYMKSGMLGMLFRKLNKVSGYAIHHLNLGRAVNIVASDLNNLDRSNFLVSVILVPFALGGTAGLLVYLWGVEGFVGPFYLLVVFVWQIIITKCTVNLRRERLALTDTRVNLMIEIVEGIRLIKLYTWEMIKLNEVKVVRAKEMRRLLKINILESMARIFIMSSGYSGAFLIYVIQKERFGTLSISKLFPTLVLMVYMRQICLIQGLMGLTLYEDLKNYFARVMYFMTLKEIVPIKFEPTQNSENSIEFDDFTGYWSRQDIQSQSDTTMVENNANSYIPVISNINLQIKKNSFTIITGKIGSGKTSLLLSLIGEITHTTGHMRYTGTSVYVSQEPILFSGPVKNSITFGRPYNEELFWKVVDACELTNSIKNLPKKEMSEIGERGVFLGIRTTNQVALARALYANADIYLLDDCFAGLDPKFVANVFNKAVRGFLREKTVVLVTHNLRLLKFADQIVVMENGKITTKGTCEELARSHNKDKDANGIGTQQEDFISKAIRENFGQEPDFWLRNDTDTNTLNDLNIVHKPYEPKEEIIAASQDKGLYIQDRVLDDGYASFKVCCKYFYLVFNWLRFPFAFVFFLLSEGTTYTFMRLNGYWSKGTFSVSAGEAIIGPVVAGSILAQLFKHLIYYYSTLNASKKLHDRMLANIVQSPLNFFDVNSLSKIASRFSAEIGILDNMFIISFLDLLEGFIFFMVLTIGLWFFEVWILLPAGIWAILFFLIVKCCKPAITQTKELDLRTKGPFLAYVLAHVRGLLMIRRLKQTDNMMDKFFEKSNDSLRASTAFFATGRVMVFLIDYAAELITFVTFCLFVHAKGTSITSGSFVNMVVFLPILQQWFLRTLVVASSLISGVARVVNYCDNYQPAPFDRIDDGDYRAAGWPQRGEIEMNEISFRFPGRNDLSLENRSVHIKAGEKIAIIGKSRGGLSLFVHLLTRTMDIENDAPRNSFIKIDGTNIQDVGLHLLRKNITVFPQDAFLFTTTIKKNLDPSGCYKDEEIWNVLDDVGLRDVVEKFQMKLDTRLTRGSIIFSKGQKHLFSVARGFLKNKTKILLQDEATVHLDISTDEHIQRKISERFKDKTFITKTSRVWTIAEYDKILVAKNNAQFECDEPYKLLVKNIGDREITNTEGYFAGLVLATDSQISRTVLQMAMRAYYKKHNLTLPVLLK